MNIASNLTEYDRTDLTWYEYDELKERIKETLGILWQTTEVRRRKISVLDEVQQILFFFRRTILELPSRIQSKTKREFERFNKKHEYKLAPFIQFGSWVGSDRDGNPNVTPQVTYRTATENAQLILKTYLGRLEDLLRQFSMSQMIVGVSSKLKASISKDRKLFPKLAKEQDFYEATELYRKKITFLHKKLENRLHHKKPCYASPEDFLHDLHILKESLDQNNGELAGREVTRLMQDVEIFGFHLTSLDFRDSSAKVRGLMKELYGKKAQDRGFLIKKIQAPARRISKKGLKGDSKDILEQFEMIHQIHETVSPAAVEDYILSHAESAEDILQLFYVAKEMGLIRVKNKRVIESHLEIVPLFESVEALGHCHRIMEELFKIPVYRSYLKSRGLIQEIMLGYSDSAKDGGYLAANWQLYRGQKKLDHLAERYGIKIELFHGKGGSVDRGGGESHRAILAQPFAATGGRIKITEQGEIVSQKYSNRVIAERNLEQLITAVVWTNLISKRRLKKNRKIARWEKRMSVLSELSFYSYRKLVFETKRFLEFYTQATPIQMIQMARIGSRPEPGASRRQTPGKHRI